ncbi:MAG: rhodanese-like domain-containing protein [Thermodesulfobacteriota bacterium]
MKAHTFIIILISLVLAGLPAYSSESGVDGKILNGYRVLTLNDNASIQDFRVYRGDYIKFKLPERLHETEVVFPTLNIQKPLTKELETTSYIKMKKIGGYLFEIDTLKGTITVIEYEQQSYKALTAVEADTFIKSNTPLILDVRTPQEYAAAHIKDAVLIPVQVLQSNLDALDKYKNKPILIYCATGNRSTVASKILIDSGYKQILNLRYGIKDWYKKGLPIIH